MWPRHASPPSASNRALKPPRAPDQAAVVRFADDLARASPASECPLLIAVSGGPDSVALLLLARQVLGARCVAATVDHGLRPEAAGEAAWVARLCSTLGVPHAVLTGRLPERDGRTRNVSARARALRYALLRTHAEGIGAAAIATAHHADDQVETLVMRLNRGAGLAGMAGVRARSDGIVRPLLAWRRAELAAVVATCGIVPVDDPSNRDARFDRARLRSAIGDAAWIEAEGWSRSARARRCGGSARLDGDVLVARAMPRRGRRGDAVAGRTAVRSAAPPGRALRRRGGPRERSARIGCSGRGGRARARRHDHARRRAVPGRARCPRRTGLALRQGAAASISVSGLVPLPLTQVRLHIRGRKAPE